MTRWTVEWLNRLNRAADTLTQHRIKYSNCTSPEYNDLIAAAVEVDYAILRLRREVAAACEPWFIIPCS
jgi:hypothetical protein